MLSQYLKGWHALSFKVSLFLIIKILSNQLFGDSPFSINTTFKIIKRILLVKISKFLKQVFINNYFNEMQHNLTQTSSIGGLITISDKLEFKVVHKSHYLFGKCLNRKTAKE